VVTGSEDEGPAESRRILERLSRESDHGGRSFVARHKYASEEKGETANGLLILLGAVLAIALFFWFLSYIAVVKS
jgi:hypothetical protein